MKHFKLTIKILSAIVVGCILTLISMMIYYQFDIGREHINLFLYEDKGNLYSYLVWILLSIISYTALNKIPIRRAT